MFTVTTPRGQSTLILIIATVSKLKTLWNSFLSPTVVSPLYFWKAPGLPLDILQPHDYCGLVLLIASFREIPSAQLKSEHFCLLTKMHLLNYELMRLSLVKQAVNQLAIAAEFNANIVIAGQNCTACGLRSDKQGVS